MATHRCKHRNILRIRKAPHRNRTDATASRWRENVDAYFHASYLPASNSDADLNHDARVALLLRTRLLQLLVLAIRQVTTRKADECRDHVHQERNEEGEAPGQVDILARDGHHDVEDDRGEGIRDTTTEVAPAGRGSIGGTDLLTILRHW